MTPPRKILLTNWLSPGDIVMLTAAVRDLHRCCPGKFVTDVRTRCPDLWLHNPHLTPLPEDDCDLERIDCHYPLIHQSNQRPYHFIHGFIEDMRERLGVRIVPMEFKGDIHLTDEERHAPPPCAEMVGDEPFWLLAAGGKFDFTIKWWESARYQAVVDHFAGRLRFVQIGAVEHHHPPLRRVVDLRGKTTLRELVRLVYHSQGAVCPVTLLMHLAAAVETPRGRPPLRPCVVIAGGREPAHWEAYPTHQFLHTVGMLDCCAEGGCWRSRVAPQGDGSMKDLDDALCRRVVGTLPRCMDMITVNDVIEAIEGYLAGGMCEETDMPVPESVEDPISVGSPADVPSDDDSAEEGEFRILIGAGEARTTLNLSKLIKPSTQTRLFTEPPVVGLVVGTFGSPAYVHLHLESRRRFYPHVPLLVHDDGSADSDTLAGLCRDYGALFETNAVRAGHQRGDLSALLGGLLWAQRREIPLLAKLSRRFIPLADWSAALASLAMDSQYATYSSWTHSWNFGFRTECVAMAVRTWHELGLVDQLLCKFLSGSHLLVEDFVHDLARRAAFHNVEAARAYDARVGPRPVASAGYAIWDFPGFDRVAPSPNFLWHNSTDAVGYFALSQQWGLPWGEEYFHVPQ